MASFDNITLGEVFSAMNGSNFSIFNANGKIPLEITSVVATSSGQFWLTMAITALSSFFILLVMWQNVLKPIVSEYLLKFSLKRLRNKTGRPILFIKHTKQDLFNQSMITQETMMQLSRALTSFEGKPFDLVLHTPGGEVFSSLMISRMLKNYPGEIRVFVPLYAMSGGTLLALSGSKIYMNDISCLGPVDPQLGNLFKYGSARGWNDIVKMKGNKAEDSSISFALMGKQYTKSIANHINELLKGKMSTPHRVQFVKFLTDGSIEHAYPLTPTELKKLHFDVQPIDKEIGKKLNRIVSSAWYEGVYHV